MSLGSRNLAPEAQIHHLFRMLLDWRRSKHTSVSRALKNMCVFSIWASGPNASRAERVIGPLDLVFSLATQDTADCLGFSVSWIPSSVK